MSDKPMTPIQFEDSLNDLIPDDEITESKIMPVINGLHTQARIKYEELYVTYQQLQQENERLRAELEDARGAYRNISNDFALQHAKNERLAKYKREWEQYAQQQIADLTAKLEAAVGPCHACRSAVDAAYVECPHSAIGKQADHIRTLESLLREVLEPDYNVIRLNLKARIRAALDAKTEGV